MRTTEVTWSEINVFRGRQNADWLGTPKDIRGSRHRKTILEKTIGVNDKAEKQMQEQTDLGEIDEVKMSRIYQLKNKKWVHIGYQCHECRKVFSDEEVREKHKYVCRRINSVLKAKEQEE
jgi:hypothetical protein